MRLELRLDGDAGRTPTGMARRFRWSGAEDAGFEPARA